MYISIPFQLFIMGTLGLMVGSFLNVVIHRLPAMIFWDGEGDYPGTIVAPRSRCPSCRNELRWYHNIPLVSYLALRGRCGFCNEPISVRYPFVEAATGAIWVIAGLVFNRPVFVFDGLVWACFASAFFTLAVIDWKTTLLPDALTLGCVWAGLLASSADFTGITLEQSLYGAVVGYLSFKAIILIGDKIAGYPTMGMGDAKLMAAIGSLLGVMALPFVLLVASLTSIVGYYWLKSRGKLIEDRYAPFGPYLVTGAVAVFIWQHLT